MTVFNWREEASQIFGTIKRPIAEILVKDSAGNWRALTLYVDSGADLTIIRRSYGELLGLDIEKGKPAAFKGFGKGEIKTFLHDLELKIGKEVIKTKVAICSDDSVPNVLGRTDIFEKYIVSFLNGKKQTKFSLPTHTIPGKHATRRRKISEKDIERIVHDFRKI